MPRKKIPPEVIEAAYAANTFVPRRPEDSARLSGVKGPSRIMYVENKSGGLSGGEARIGRVTFSKSGSTIYYGMRAFRSLKGRGYKANYREMETGDLYWISGPRKDGGDRLYGERVKVVIDENAREEYWNNIRGLPNRQNEALT
jgi:hypothetical protein